MQFNRSAAGITEFCFDGEFYGWKLRSMKLVEFINVSYNRVIIRVPLSNIKNFLHKGVYIDTDEVPVDTLDESKKKKFT